MDAKSRLFLLSKKTRGYFPLKKTIFNVAKILIEDWETNSNNKTNKLALYIYNILNSLKEITDNLLFPLICSLIYTQKLRNKYKTFKGESGCSYRLFSASIMISSKHWTHIQPELTRRRKKWCEIIKLFPEDELVRMETELVSFLKRDLNIEYNEFFKLIETNFFEETDSVVPGDENRIFEIGHCLSENFFRNMFD